MSPTPVDQQVVLAPGQSASITSDVSVRFNGVSGDSRCPGDALCILGGDAIVAVTITAGRSTADRDLHTGNMQPVTHDGVRIDLVQLEPYPFSSLGPIDPASYRATLRVTR